METMRRLEPLFARDMFRVEVLGFRIQGLRLRI